MDFTEFSNGGSHEENQFGGIPQGINNRVEQGETKYNNYIFSDRLTITEDISKRFGISRKYIGKTFSEASKKIVDKERKNQYIDKKTQEAMLNRLIHAQEFIKESFLNQNTDPDQNTNYYLTGGELMMLAPIITSAAQTAFSIFNKPKYLEKQTINPIVSEKQLDRTQIERNIENQASNLRRSLTDVAAGNQAYLSSNLLASQSSISNTLANANMQAELINMQEKNRNEAIKNNAQSINARIRASVDEINARERGAYVSNISSSLTNLSNNLGLLGKQELMKEIIANSLGYDWRGNYIKSIAQKDLKKGLQENTNLNTQNQESVENNNQNDKNIGFKKFRSRFMTGIDYLLEEDPFDFFKE